MAFATTILDKQAARSFGITFDLYNAVTYDTITVSCSPSRAFQPTYQPSALETSQPTFELRFGKPMSKLSDFTWAVANGPCQAGANISHTRMSDLFANGYSAIGQTVKLRMLVLNSATTEGSERWRGIITDCKWDLERVEFTAKHVVLKALEAITPATKIMLGNYPNAPTDSIGGPLPIVLGDWGAEPCHGAYTDAWNINAEIMGLAALDRVLPLVKIEEHPGKWATNTVYAIAGHPLKALPDTAKTAGVFLRVNTNPVAYGIFDSSLFTLANGTPSTLTLPFSPHISVQFPPKEAAAGNDCIDPANSADYDIMTYTQLTATHPDFVMAVDPPPDLGAIVSASIWLLINNTATGGASLTFGLWDLDASPPDYWGSYTTISGALLLDEFHYHTASGVILKTVSDLPSNLALVASLTGATGGALQIKEARLVITYSPRHLGNTRPTGPGDADLWRQRHSPWDRVKNYWWQESDKFPAYGAEGNPVYVACTGVPDTAGMYTGTGTDLIERPCDIIMYLAATQALLSPLTTGHGAFTVARADIDAIGLTGRVFIDKQQVVGDLMSRLAEESLCGLMLNATSLGLVFWGSVWSDNYYGAIDGADLMGTPEIGMTSLDEIRNAIYIQCGWHATLKKCKHMAYCDKDGSDNGVGVADFPATGAVSKASLQASEDAYGRKELHLNCEHLRVAEISHIRDYYAAMLQAPRITVKFTVPWKYYALEGGHVIDMDDASWRALGLNYPGSSGGKVGYWSYGAETHRFWVERITYQEHGTMEIEASEGVW